MTQFFQNLFAKYPRRTRRILEIIPGLAAWTLILSPVWGSLLLPTGLVYFILFFDIWFFYKSFLLVITAYISSNKIKAAQAQNWYTKIQQHPDVDKVTHVLVMPNYKESIAKMRTTITNLTHQSFPLKQIYIVLAMEEREEEAEEKAATLIKEFKPYFGDIFASYHPDVIGEVKGKSSNEAFGGREAYRRLFANHKRDINFATVTSVDVDSMFDKEYFAYLTYKFLHDSRRYNKFWQSAIVFYNNIWEVPAPIRIVTFFGSLWRISLLIQGDRLVTQSTYSLSFRMLKEIDFWDVDVIPEDYRVFFKSFFRKKGQVWVEPIFLHTSMDAPLSKGYINSLLNKYNQERRWSWGVSDDPLFMTWYLTVPGVPFLRKTNMIYHVILDHWLWPVNWFIITIAANALPLINPVYARTSLGFYLPRLAGSIMTVCLLAIVCMIYIDYKNTPKHKAPPLRKKLFFPCEFVLMPIVGFFLSALPALISHTQLMFGKRLEYKVTEKI